MKKFLLALLAVVFAACLAGAVACSGGDTGNYHVLIFRHAEGVEYVFDTDIQSGMEVKDGVTVHFTLKIDGEAKGEPSVFANDTEIKPDGNGIYSLTVVADTLVEVRGVTYYPNHAQMIFDSNGVTYTIENEGLENGMFVRRGTEVRFTVKITDGYILDKDYDSPKIYVNGAEVQPDANGVYSFVIENKTDITCAGVVKPVRVHFNSGDTSENNYGDNLVFYFAEDGSEFTADSDIVNTFIKGETLKFKVSLSVYAKQNPYDAETKTGYKVLANGYTLYPDSEGYYTASLDSDTNTIGLQGIELDDPFTSRPDGGSGTAADPFKISRPIDLWQMAGLINGGFYIDGGFFAGHYEMENDIDMHGERLYIIGDASDENGYAIFCGDFNGNGKTISNFTINNIVMDADTNVPVARPYVGLFGYVTAAMRTSPAIYNLNLDNFTITANNSNSSNEMSVGAFVGEGIGVTITGCSATNGTIEVTGGNITSTTGFMPAYAGGLIGRQMSAASIDGTINVYAGITSCYSDVDIQVQSGYVESTGGIAAQIAASTDRLSAFVLNSYSTGNIEGGARAGGIVGYAAPGTSVINCYSTGDVSSANPFEEGMLSDPSFNYSYAGGLVGYAGFNCVVYNSFSMSDVYAQASAGNEKYAQYDQYVAHCDTGDALEDVTSFEPVIYKCYGKDGGFAVTEDFIRNILKWAEADWLIENGMPVIHMCETSKEFTISFSVDDKFGNKPDSKTITDQYKPMSSWYSDKNGISEFKDGDNGNRSYAYFFDEELTMRVPYSFIPTDDITLYIGYADYTEVAGKYYLGGNVNVNATLELNKDGTFTFRKGALNHTSIYTWDGTTISLKASALGILNELDIDDEIILEYYLSSYYNYGATLADGKLTITGGYVSEVERIEIDGELTEGLQYTGEVIYMFPEESPLYGVKEVEGFKYGSYYSDNTVYNFNGNGSGEIVTEGSSKPFKFTVQDNNITIEMDGDTVTATIKDGYLATWNGTAVKSYDGFTGVWETSYNLYKSYEFDGKASTDGEGTWSYKGYDSTSNGTYTVENGVLTDKNGAFTAQFDENGVLVITEKEKKTNYYGEGSFMGDWYFNHVKTPISVSFKGITKNGYGDVEVEDMSDANTVIPMVYSVETVNGTQTVSIYNNEQLFATLTYDEETKLLSGTVNGIRNARLCAYDVFRGSWISDDESLGDVQFNGEGLYNLSGSDSLIEVKGTAYIQGKRVSYTYDREKNEATFTFSNTKYTLKYDESTGNISVSAESKNFNLVTLDDWYGVELIDSEDFVYTFDGRSKLKNGKAKATAKKGETTREYKYSLDEDNKLTLTVSDSDASYKGGTIEVQTKDGHSVWVFTTTDGDTKLTRNTKFTGTWIVGNEPGELTIGKIYADNKADGSYKFYGENSATEVEFTYYPEGNYLTFTEKDRTIYVNVFNSLNDDVKELSIGPENSTIGANNSVCIEKEKEDEWHGKEYELYNFTIDEENGNFSIGEKYTDGATLIFDGLSTATFSNGRASIYTDKGREAVFTYSKNAYGYPQLVIEGYTFLLVPVNGREKFTTEVAYCVKEGDTAYVIVRPDALMGLKLNDRFLKGVTYEFDGTGLKVVRTENGEETEYMYSFVSSDTANNFQTLEFKDKDGKTSTVVLDYSASYNEDWTIFFCNSLQIKGKNNASITYDIVDASKIIKHDADGTQTEFSYTVDKYDYENYLHVLNIKNGDKEFKAGLDMSGDKNNWTFVEYDAMYGRVIADRLANGVNYRFDGEGNVTRIYGDVDEEGNATTPNEEFTYTLTETDDGFVCEFTKNGAKYSVDIDSHSPNSADWTIIVYDLTVYEKGDTGYFYQLKDDDTLVYGLGGSSTTEYSYVIKVDNGTYIHTLVLTPKDGGEQITVRFNLYSYSKSEWFAEKVTEDND